MDSETLIKQAAGLIASASSLLISAGAGMGVDSGLPDFRGDRGFWKAYPPYAKLGYRFIDLANPRWFQNDPALAWGFYGHRLNLYRQTIPHPGFKIILSWANRIKNGLFVFTSNVDGQFQKAGFPENRIMECHGSIHHFQCCQPCRPDIWDAGREAIDIDESTFRAHPPFPVCPRCEKIARPNILMFGDEYWLAERTNDQNERYWQWLSACGDSPVILECGAGTAVPTVRYNSENVIYRRRARLIRINARDSHVPAGSLGIPMSALEALQRINSLLT